MPAPELFVGLMSGTSLDGIDAALVAFEDGAAPRLITARCDPWDAALRERLLALHTPAPGELDAAMRLAGELSERYAASVRALLAESGLRPAQVSAIGCHGQTLRHRPDLGYSLQLVDGARLAERTGIATITDFRSRDIAAGGQGAPLVPAFHAACLASDSEDIAVLNIGGIANVSLLGKTGEISGFDTGPGNMLMDAWTRACWGEDCDRGGDRASRGRIDAALLAMMLADDYLELAPPKSTGRERFGQAWLDGWDFCGLADEDVLATLTEFTARSAADAIVRHCATASRVLVCGGGAHNAQLMRRLAAALAPRRVESTAARGIDPDWMEAMAFAWLARRALRGEPGNVPEVTGAAGPRVLGAIHPA